jgi:hypothetical protein
MVIRLSPQQFLELGLKNVVGFDNSRLCRATILCHWHAYYGASPETCASVFVDLQTTNIADERVD